MSMSAIYAERCTRDQFFALKPEASEQDWSSYHNDTCAMGLLIQRGISVDSQRVLTKVTQSSWSGGRFNDGVGHYEERVYVTGQTYHLRNELKQNGFRWDGQRKGWYLTIKHGNTYDQWRVAVRMVAYGMGSETVS